MVTALIVSLLSACAGSAGPGPAPADADTVPSVDKADTGTPGDSGQDGGTDSAEPVEDTAWVDADGDGHPSIESGGDDCDDADPWTHPGAEEWCDPVDHDCDGNPLASGVCGKPQYSGLLHQTSWLPPDENKDHGFDSVAPVGDLDGDGASEWAGTCYECTAEHGGGATGLAALIRGGSRGRDQRIDMATTTWFYGYDGCDWRLGQGLSDIGDTDGDGLRDLAMMTSDMDACAGKAWLLHGPVLDRGPGTDVYDAMDVGWLHYQDSDFGHHDMVPGDYDGDGLSDLAVGAPDSIQQVSPRVWILPGGTYDERYQYLDDESWTTSDGDSGYGGAIEPLGDVDGDGLDDLLIGQSEPDGWSLLGGDDLSSSHGAAAGDLALESYQSSLGICVADLGDLDGDGTPERAIGAPYDDSGGHYAGAIYVLSGIDSSRHGVEVSEISDAYWVGTHDREWLGRSCWHTQFSGHVGGELLVARFNEDGEQEKAMFSMQGMPLAGEPIAGALIMRSDSPPGAETVPAVSVKGGADYDGDGFEDLLSPYYHLPESSRPSGFALVHGWEVPWDEPEWW
jgi:hypothetical protein